MSYYSSRGLQQDLIQLTLSKLCTSKGAYWGKLHERDTIAQAKHDFVKRTTWLLETRLLTELDAVKYVKRTSASFTSANRLFRIKRRKAT